MQPDLQLLHRILSFWAEPRSLKISRQQYTDPRTVVCVHSGFRFFSFRQHSFHNLHHLLLLDLLFICFTCLHIFVSLQTVFSEPSEILAQQSSIHLRGSYCFSFADDASFHRLTTSRARSLLGLFDFYTSPGPPPPPPQFSAQFLPKIIHAPLADASQ